MTTPEVAAIVLGILVAGTAILVQAVLGFKWLTGIEARIGAHERGCDERMRRLDERHAAILISLGDIKSDVKSIASRV